MDAGFDHARRRLEHQVAGVGCAAGGLEVDRSLPGADLGQRRVGPGDGGGTGEALCLGAAFGGVTRRIGRHAQIAMPQAG
ncbi:MAG: hypothetical protein K0M46_00350, partial [Thiobacillus sp.]|nr:hypothetical protein [Thiobacillus sp.]